MSRASAIVTGGAGFIGSHLVKALLTDDEYEKVIVIDSLTYASELSNLDLDNSRLEFHKADIADASEIAVILNKHSGQQLNVFHLAAESHVDRSINSGIPFIHSNLMGTQVLIEACLQSNVNRFLHVSTDEVYGSLQKGEATETSELKPSSAYSATKAGSDMLVLAAGITHGLDVVVTRCVNNYGPNQAPEKFIPRMIINALLGEALPIYGDGLQVREWLSVDDHIGALRLVMKQGEKGKTYNIGSLNRKTNLELARAIIDFSNSSSTLNFVVDRKGHDLRYALDSSFIRCSLGWKSERDIMSDLPMLIESYRLKLDNPKMKNKFDASEAFYESI